MPWTFFPVSSRVEYLNNYSRSVIRKIVWHFRLQVLVWCSIYIHTHINIPVSTYIRWRPHKYINASNLNAYVYLHWMFLNRNSKHLVSYRPKFRVEFFKLVFYMMNFWRVIYYWKMFNQMHKVNKRSHWKMSLQNKLSIRERTKEKEFWILFLWRFFCPFLNVKYQARYWVIGTRKD